MRGRKVDQERAKGTFGTIAPRHPSGSRFLFGSRGRIFLTPCRPTLRSPMSKAVEMKLIPKIVLALSVAVSLSACGGGGGTPIGKGSAPVDPARSPAGLPILLPSRHGHAVGGSEECSPIASNSAAIAPALSSCFDLLGSDITLRMPLNSCLLQDENNPVRFHVISCGEAATASCRTDLDDGKVIYYERRGNEVVPTAKPCP